MLLNRAWTNRLSSHGTPVRPARLTTFLSGPDPFYSTQHVSKVQNPKPNDRMSVGHSRSKGELRERERERILLRRGGLGLLFDSEHGVFWSLCGIIFFSMASVATREDGEVGAAVEKDAGDEVQYNAQGKKKGKHDKPKPWDTPDIDHWKLERFDPSWNEGGMLEESSFSTLFPQYRGSLSLSLSLSLSPVFGDAVWWKLAD